MSVAPTSAAAALASTAAASERASKVQTNSKEADQARRTKHGTQTGDRVVLSPEAIQRKQSVTDRAEGHPEAPGSKEEQTRHIDVEG